jgi:hypothetical protein
MLTLPLHTSPHGRKAFRTAWLSSSGRPPKAQHVYLRSYVTSSQTNFLNRYSFTDLSRPRPFSRSRTWLCEHRDSCGRRVHTVALCLSLVNMYSGPAQVLLRPCSGYAQDAHPRLSPLTWATWARWAPLSSPPERAWVSWARFTTLARVLTSRFLTNHTWSNLYSLTHFCQALTTMLKEPKQVPQVKWIISKKYI